MPFSLICLGCTAFLFLNDIYVLKKNCNSMGRAHFALNAKGLWFSPWHLQIGWEMLLNYSTHHPFLLTMLVVTDRAVVPQHLEGNRLATSV